MSFMSFFVYFFSSVGHLVHRSGTIIAILVLKEHFREIILKSDHLCSRCNLQVFCCF